MIACTVKLKHITKLFGRKNRAVDDVSLTIEGGKMVSLLGPSGCGKTTTLRIIAGLETQTSGDIMFDDTNVNNISTPDRQVAMVFQSYALYPHMSVRKNLGYGLKMRKAPVDEIQRKIENISTMLGLNELLDRRPGHLSGGQQQRVALGRAIVRDPKVFLLDEPLSNLDAKLRAKMRTEIVTLQKKLGHTMIYVTHDQLEAMSMSDEIVLMNKGRIVQVDSPMVIFERPRNMFVADFIGTPSINFLPAKTEDQGGRLCACVGSWQIQLQEQLSVVVKEKNVSDIILGIRPEHLTIERNPTTQNGLAQITVIEPVGSEMIVHTQVADKQVVVKCPIDKDLIIGQMVQLVPMSDKIHLFDPDTEESLGFQMTLNR
jgi:multiple sugar transport system ATP-binding protein